MSVRRQLFQPARRSTRLSAQRRKRQRDDDIAKFDPNPGRKKRSFNGWHAFLVLKTTELRDSFPAYEDRRREIARCWNSLTDDEKMMWKQRALARNMQRVAVVRAPPAVQLPVRRPLPCPIFPTDAQRVVVHAPPAVQLPVFAARQSHMESSGNSIIDEEDPENTASESPVKPQLPTKGIFEFPRLSELFYF